MQLLGNRVLVEPIAPPTTSGGIHIPESARDEHNTGGAKLYRVVQVGPGREVKGRLVPIECEPGDRVLCHSYTSGPQDFPDGRKIITADQIIAVLPNQHHDQNPSPASSDAAPQDAGA